MEPAKKRYSVLKVLLGLLPALILTQNYAWMTSNRSMGVGFLIIYALVIWSAWFFTEKNHILERHFRLTEVALFLLPISSVILSFSIGASAISSTTDEFAQAGAAIGSAVGGFIVIAVSFVVGITGGVIMHLIANNYGKKTEGAHEKQIENASTKHGVIITLGLVLLIAMIVGVSGAASTTEETQLNSSGNGTSSASQPEPTIANIGDKVDLDTFSLTVLSSKEQQTISSTWDSQAAKTGAKFVVINMSVVANTDSEFTFFPNDDMKLVDASGRKFSTYDDTIGAINNYLEVRTLSPGIPETGVVVYEVPTDSTSYALVATNDATGITYSIQLANAVPAIE